jgi:hypothetical protein
LATRIAAPAPSALQRATISGPSTSTVVRRLRLVGAPWKRAVTAPMRPAAAARRNAGNGNQVPGSSAVVCWRSIATCAMRTSWSRCVSPEYTLKNFALAL